MKKPVIGITLDSENIGGYSKWYPWYALRKNYVEAIEQLGAIPILIPHHISLVNDYYEMIDGLLVPGGDVDIDPKHYGAKNCHEKVKTNPSRTDFEFALAKLAIKNQKPIFGICGGEQLINVVLGGTLIQHIPDVVGHSNHEQKIERHVAAHKVDVKKGSLLHKIIGSTSMQVNSTHHQSVEKLGKGLVACGTSPDDNIIEAIEHKAHPFCLGVQWHPEYSPDPSGNDKKIFKAFVESCK